MITLPLGYMRVKVIYLDWHYLRASQSITRLHQSELYLGGYNGEFHEACNVSHPGKILLFLTVSCKVWQYRLVAILLPRVSRLIVSSGHTAENWLSSN
jgi:hypothetical protein